MTGSILALLALGYNLVLVGAGVFNFTQGQMMMVGTCIAYVGAVKAHLPLWLIPIIGIVFGFLIGSIVNVVAIHPVRQRPGNAVLVTTLGAGVVLDGLATKLFGTNPDSVPFWGSNSPMNLTGGRLLPSDRVTIIIAFGATALIWALKTRTFIGVSASAASEDPPGRAAARHQRQPARSDLRRCRRRLGGAVGIIIAQQLDAVPTSGDLLAIEGFVVLAVGGFGSELGALVGGLSVGLADALAQRYIGGQYDLLVVFGLLLAVLLVKPGGLFVKHRVRVV